MTSWNAGRRGAISIRFFCGGEILSLESTKGKVHDKLLLLQSETVCVRPRPSRPAQREATVCFDGTKPNENILFSNSAARGNSLSLDSVFFHIYYLPPSVEEEEEDKHNS